MLIVTSAFVPGRAVEGFDASFSPGLPKRESIKSTRRTRLRRASLGWFLSVVHPKWSRKPAFNWENIELVGEVTGGDGIPHLPTQGLPRALINDGQDFQWCHRTVEWNGKSTSRKFPGASAEVMVGGSETPMLWGGVSRAPEGLLNATAPGFSSS